MSKIWLLGATLLSPTLAYAQDTSPSEEPLSPLTSEIEFGYQSHSGNSESQALNSRLDLEYISGRYRTSGEWKFYLLYKDGEEDKRQSTYSFQSDYKLSAKTYLYGSFKGIDSRYSAYFKDYTFSGGLGYQFSNTDELVLELEFGPGFRYQEPNKDEIDDDDIIFPDIVEEPIFQGSVNSVWQALDNLSIGAKVTVIAGRSNTRTDSEISVTNNITDDIALKIAHNRQYHDKVPEGLEKADSIFSVNLLFLF